MLVIVDKLSKVEKLSPMRASYTTSSIVHVFLEDIVQLHGIPCRIVSDRDSIFTSALWMSLQYGLGTQLNFSSAYHLETDGQTKRLN